MGDALKESSAKKQESTPWLCLTHRVGQLGNRLFLSAHIMAFARAKGLRGVNLALAEYADFFVGSAGCCFPRLESMSPLSAGQRNVPNQASFLWRRGLAQIADAVANLMGKWRRGSWRTLDILESHDPVERVFPLEDMLRMEGWAQWRGVFLRGWKFRWVEDLESHRAFLQEYFSPVMEVSQSVEGVLRAARERGDFLLGVHIRRGDYRQWQGGKYFFEHVQYARWMEEAQVLWSGKRVVFVVCSNEAWPEQWTARFPIFAGPGDPVGDLYALAGCDAIIAPPSSFALWASFIGPTPLHMLEKTTQKLHPVSFTFHPSA